MRKLCKIQLICLFLILCFWGCESELDKYYARPDWLKGNALEVLEERGNFTHFIQALEKAGYKSMLNGRELCTVLAPNDEAFERYFTRHGYSSVADIPTDILEVLIPYHILQNAFEEKSLLEFTTSSDPKVTGDGTSYKYETYAHSPITTMTYPLDGRSVKIYGQSKYLPIISTKLYDTRNCTDPEANYKYFFPTVNWQGNDKKLYITTAAVIETNIPTDNGYIYVLDDVCEPLRTIYKALESPKENDFSKFLTLYDRFAEIAQEEIVGGDTLFNYNHYRSANKAKSVNYQEQLPSIASEWGYQGELNNNQGYYNLYKSWTYNCFAPTNAALDAFFETNFEGFARLEDVPLLTLYYLFRSFVREQQQIIVPEQLDRDGLKGALGEDWNISLNNVVNRELCANGVLYGLNETLMPALFELVTKPLFTTPDYSIMSNMLFKTEQFNVLVDPQTDRFTLFVVADTTLEDTYGYLMDYGSDLFNDTDEAVMLNGDKMTTEQMQLFVETHVAEEAIRNFNQRKFYATKNGYNYIYSDNGILYGEDGSYVEILKSWETKNGPTYQINAKFNKSNYSIIDVLTGVDYTDFFNLLKTAGIISATNEFVTIDKEERVILFAPKNGTYDKDALAALETEQLARILSYHFILTGNNSLNEYILPNSGPQGAFLTMAQDPDNSTNYKTEYYTLGISYFNNEKLQLTNTSGVIYYTDGSIPAFATNGLVYPVEGVLPIK